MGWIFAAVGWTFAVVFASLFFMEIGTKPRKRDEDALCRYFEKRLKEVALAGLKERGKDGGME